MRFLKTYGVFLFFVLLTRTLSAQSDFQNRSSNYIGEIGMEAGLAHYFGDLNSTTSFHSPKPIAGIFYRYFFNTYIGASAHLHFAQLGYSDVYNADTFQHIRNLSFNTHIAGLSLQADFNFFKFEPGSISYRFTPYLTLGVGAIHFNPYAFYENKKYYLQPLGTEGQGSPLYPDRKKYPLWTFEIPIGLGIKYNINSQWNIGFNVTYHYTGTDYLDDVSSTYAGAAAFPPGLNGKENIAAKLQDRSGFYGQPIGVTGRQRGNSNNNDQFVGIELNIAYLFTNYRCPVF